MLLISGMRTKRLPSDEVEACPQEGFEHEVADGSRAWLELLRVGGISRKGGCMRSPCDSHQDTQSPG
ncbi:hypothetical protein D3C87_918680 [compost metagenome]